MWAVSSAVEHYVDIVGVTSSILVPPTSLPSNFNGRWLLPYFVLVIRPGLPRLSNLPEGPRGRVLIVRIVVAVDAARRAVEIDQPYWDAKRESLAD